MVSGYILKNIIEQEGNTVYISTDGNRLVELVVEKHIDIVLLNIVLPEANGFDLLKALQDADETKDIPVIIVSGATSVLDVKRALDGGAADFIRKSCEPLEIVARVHAALKLKRKHEQLVLSSERDHLTQLFNKRFFNNKLEKQLQELAQIPNGIGLVMLDCDNFKSINDIYGHTFGDYELASVANSVSKSLKFGDYACRFGGEEFSVILNNVTPFQAYVIAERIRMNVEKMGLMNQSQPIVVTTSCGVSHTGGSHLGGQNGGGEEKASAQLVNEADTALYEAKRRGRNQSVLYTDINDQLDM